MSTRLCIPLLFPRGSHSVVITKSGVSSSLSEAQLSVSVKTYHGSALPSYQLVTSLVICLMTAVRLQINEITASLIVVNYILCVSCDVGLSQ
jgi:hypothetical protein